MMIVIIIFGIACITAATLTLAAGILASRLNRCQPAIEKYEDHSLPENYKRFTPRTYLIESND